jgi:hypothetical protein
MAGVAHYISWSGLSADSGTFDRRIVLGEDRSPLVDLSHTSFVTAYGLVALACVLVSNQANGAVTRVQCPEKWEVGSYLSRMGFRDVLDRHDCHLVTDLPQVGRHDQRGSLLELQQFRVEDDVSKLSNLVTSRLETAGRVSPQSITAIDIGLGEIADNVRYHSETGWGFIAAQTYMAGTTSEAIDVAIGDTGIGIRKGLARHAPSDDFEAVRMALDFEYSGVDDPGRGQGLPTTSEKVTGIRGSLHFKTGDASVIVSSGPLYEHRTAHFSGTIIGLRVPCRPGA